MLARLKLLAGLLAADGRDRQHGPRGPGQLAVWGLHADCVHMHAGIQEQQWRLLCAERAEAVLQPQHAAGPKSGSSRLTSTLCCSSSLCCFLSWSCWQASLSKLLLFERLDKASQGKVVEHTWTRTVSAGEILIQEGETGLAASELYVVKDGTFEVGPAHWQCCQMDTSA